MTPTERNGTRVRGARLSATHAVLNVLSDVVAGLEAIAEGQRQRTKKREKERKKKKKVE